MRMAVWRIEIRRLLPLLPIRRRVAVALEFGFDPTPWVDELAGELEEPVQAVVERVRAVARGGDAEAVPRVLYPKKTPALARDAFRQVVKHGLEQLRKHVATQQGWGDPCV